VETTGFLNCPLRDSPETVLFWAPGRRNERISLRQAALTPPYEGRELIRQLDEVGSKSLPLVAMAGAAIGVILSLEARYSLSRFGAKSMFPVTLVYSVIQVMGPVITGLVVSGRVGAGILGKRLNRVPRIFP
jgi:ABC-type transporter Mla maintaining outer membrane lipid asymmetry permease subunit MlaE